LDNFQIVRDNYSGSIFYDIAGERIAFCEKRIAEHDYNVGRFYYKIGMYRPAIKRLKSYLKKFDDADLKIRAMGILAESLWKDEQNERALMLYKEIALVNRNSAYGRRALQMLTLYGNDYDIEIPGSLK